MENFSKAEYRFLTDASTDYVPLHAIVLSFKRSGGIRPTQSEFLRTLDFIAYLFKKYGKHLKCLEGPDMHQIKGTPPKIISWLKQQWEEREYKEIDLGIWFALDREVIPPHLS